MNRQLKRANEKSDKKREREQTRRKEQRRENRTRAVQARRTASPKKSETGKAKGQDRPAPGTGRSIFNVAYLLFTTSVIVSQAFVPQQTSVLSFVTHVMIYLILGYFFVLWLYRRGVAQAFAITLAAGFGLALGVEGLKALVPQLGLPQVPEVVGTSSAPNLLYVALAVPGLLVGTWLGRYIYKKS